MASLQIVGWRVGPRKVARLAMSQALQRHLGLGPATADAIAEQVLAGATATLDVADATAAVALAGELAALGAVVTLGGPDTIV
jgi:hypothetical protein